MFRAILALLALSVLLPAAPAQAGIDLPVTGASSVKAKKPLLPSTVTHRLTIGGTGTGEYP